MKWVRRIVLLAPAVGSTVMAWQMRSDAFCVWLGLLAAALWLRDGARRIEEVESE